MPQYEPSCPAQSFVNSVRALNDNKSPTDTDLLDANEPGPQTRVMERTDTVGPPMKKAQPGTHSHIATTGNERDRTGGWISARKRIIRIALSTEDDHKKINNQPQEETMQQIRSAEKGWQHIGSFKVCSHDIRLVPKTNDSLDGDEIERSVRESGIPPALGLSVGCKISDEWILAVVAGQPSKSDLPRPADRVKSWSEENNMWIKNARWQGQQLFLSMGSLEDAWKPTRHPIFLDGRDVKAVPIDRRSIPLFCYRCWGPSHFKNTCKALALRCGKCAGNHEIRDCSIKQGSPQTKCPNCEGTDHFAWQQRCRAPAVVAMTEICRGWRERGPPWARPAPSNNQASSEPLRTYHNIGGHKNKANNNGDKNSDNNKQPSEQEKRKRGRPSKQDIQARHDDKAKKDNTMRKYLSISGDAKRQKLSS